MNISESIRQKIANRLKPSFRLALRTQERLKLMLPIKLFKVRKPGCGEGWFSGVEAAFLRDCVRKAKSLPGVIVEIGSYLGKSSIVIAQEAKENQDEVYCVDIWDNSVYDALPKKQRRIYGCHIPKNAFEQFIANIKAANVYDVITPIRGKSEDIAKNWRKPIKLLFIDACHEYEYVIKDCSLWKKYVVQNGFILFHDYDPFWPGVVKAVDECINEKEFNDIGQRGGVKGFVKK